MAGRLVHNPKNNSDHVAVLPRPYTVLDEGAMLRVMVKLIIETRD